MDRLHLHQTGDAHEVSERHHFSLQGAHGNNVLALIIKDDTVDACVEEKKLASLSKSGMHTAERKGGRDD